MFYRVQRKSEKITLLEEMDKEQVYGVNQKDYMEINDQVIVDKISEYRAQGLTVVFNTITEEIETRVDKYRDIPTTDIKRVQALKHARFMLDSLVKEVEMVDYISYIDANNILNSKGFFVTDENREEVYLDILEAGDELIIDTLEEFLTLKDKLTTVKSAKREYDEIVETVHGTSEEDLNINKLFS